MRIDLREAPLYFIAFVGGWLPGVIAMIIPFIYRMMMEGPTVWLGIMQAIILPVLIGSLFHDWKNYRPPYAMVNIKRMMIGLAVFEVIKSLWMVASTPATAGMVLMMALMAAIGVLALGWILNDTHLNIIRWKALEHDSTQDALTGLPNLRFFHEQVRELKYRGVPMAIVMMDVDHFKNYNDTHGHPAGDAVLRSIGRLMEESARPGDVIARYGGEEFILCFTNVSSVERSFELADALRERIEGYAFYGADQQPGGCLTVSLGAALAETEQPLDELIEQADRALYESKKSGRNQVSIAKLNAEKEAEQHYQVNA
ncbi:MULTISPECIES: diguanylate cyclase [unclassified Planococcus (in: firmicutes)]|uniref:GGDEF domain-containing protein n=1 Tax=unclassified Planococcus (in: firmicutes) TaxID=2662419 RepID=UPI000C33BF8B|nr:MULTISPECIES: diguanylate cyclase [unclassified Planococcus (in: firmicutes)]AUD14436.1 GGDEF domain-containing protein [Planococcus sp. MB-3u-03]PKG44711.1 GGDEF domain-containing protein [Planococcus sp. Urea-trap-24]PKG87055.1 GGDEF domain-containing protein [Planococcus sp. Urea-3u-39]PKH41109.1 GGDEF domain-containing protein [Planococcus sp. MB-3u-09]